MCGVCYLHLCSATWLSTQYRGAPITDEPNIRGVCLILTDTHWCGHYRTHANDRLTIKSSCDISHDCRITRYSGWTKILRKYFSSHYNSRKANPHLSAKFRNPFIRSLSDDNRPETGTETDQCSTSFLRTIPHCQKKKCFYSNLPPALPLSAWGNSSRSPYRLTALTSDLIAPLLGASLSLSVLHSILVSDLVSDSVSDSASD